MSDGSSATGVTDGFITHARFAFPRRAMFHSARALARFAARRRHAFGATARHLSSGVDGCQTVGVIGMGLMGHGIAQVAATAGFDVVAV